MRATQLPGPPANSTTTPAAGWPFSRTPAQGGAGLGWHWRSLSAPPCQLGSIAAPILQLVTVQAPEEQAKQQGHAAGASPIEVAKEGYPCAKFVVPVLAQGLLFIAVDCGMKTAGTHWQRTSLSAPIAGRQHSRRSCWAMQSAPQGAPSNGSMHHRKSELTSPEAPPSSPSSAWCGKVSLITWFIVHETFAWMGNRFQICHLASFSTKTAVAAEGGAVSLPCLESSSTLMMASSQFLSVSVTRSVVPLKLIVRGLSTASMMICRGMVRYMSIADLHAD